MIDYKELDKVNITKLWNNLYEAEYNGKIMRLNTNMIGKYAIKILFLELFREEMQKLNIFILEKG
jgi:hypothetical protein